MEYILILLWIGLMAVIAKYANIKRTVLVEGAEEQRYSWLFALVVFLPIIWIAGHRPETFSDTYNYAKNFLNGPKSFDDLWTYTLNTPKDRAYYFVSGAMRIILGPNPEAYFTIIAAIQGIFVLNIFRKYSEEYILSVFFFVASAEFMWMFNGIRQFMAAVIIFLATPLLLKKKYIPLIMVIIFASLFHQSALIMIPIIFIVQGTAWNKRTIVFIIVLLLIIVFIGNFTSFLNDSLEGTQYADAAKIINSDESRGTNPLRVLFFSIPTIMAFFTKKTILAENNKMINICVNMSIISTGLYVVSMFTSGMLVARLPIYASLYNHILLPWILLRAIKNKKITTIIIASIFLLFYYFQLHVTWNLF